MKLPQNEPILNFNQFFQHQRLNKYTFNNSDYVPIAESILSNDDIYLSQEQNLVLKFIIEKRLPLENWKSLNENLFSDAINFIQNQIIEPSTNAIKGAINWAIELGSDLVSAISSVVERIMEGVQTAWDSVKIETNKWFSGNRSLKRQMTISINQQIASIKESLNEDFAEENKIIWESLTKETGQLSNMFVETIGKVITGDVFASKVTMSINKVVNESNTQNLIENDIKSHLLNFIPDAIKQNILDINNHEKFNIDSIKVTNYKHMSRIDESIQLLDNFYKWCIEKLDYLPPFSWIKDFSDYIKTNANESLEYSSKFLNENFGINGPYKFEILGPTFAILINALSDFGKYILIDSIIASISNIIIPGSGPIVMFLLNIYAFWVLAEVIYDLINDFSEDNVQPQN
jgi:hypothetical protein